MNRWRLASAAAVLFLLVGSGYLWLTSRNSTRQSHREELTSRAPLKHDAAPGKAGAVLTLANGSQIILDSATNGMLTQQGNTRIKNLNGALTYTRDTDPDTAILYNYLATRRGEQYPLTLSDGTKIWLNAASSIRYPVAFSGTDRTVEISGEAYAEVAPDAARPFRVRLRDRTQIQVLGTRFNINSYEDENTITTSLLEGAL
jgi:ferric-dicitrate binding protein FerR (iron transport regulator)